MVYANKYIDVSAMSKVLWIGLVAGAGLVAVFAFGLAAAGRATGDGTAGTTVARGRAGNLLLAGVCFAIVAVGVVAGIWLMVHKK